MIQPARPSPAPRRRISIALALLAGLMAQVPEAARAADSAVVFMYHRFGESGFPSTSVRLDQFEAHIAELKSGRYAVLPLPEIVAALRGGTKLPANAIGISVDDAYLSVYTEAWPRLRAGGLPFTLFVATDPVDRKLAGVMTWDQIRELARAGVTIGAHSAAHLHMADSSADENRADLERSKARFRAELGTVPALFAYPYGEMGRAVGSLVREAGFATAFGQHSGVLHPAADFSYLPRFAVNEHYGDLERFRMASRALPLPVRDFTPADPLIGSRDNPPAVGFTLDAEFAERSGQLACYSSHEGRTGVEKLGPRMEIRMGRPLPAGRSRINCTLPGPDGRWHWFGIQLYLAKPAR